jgi:hypothetical protein
MENSFNTIAKGTWHRALNQYVVISIRVTIQKCLVALFRDTVSPCIGDLRGGRHQGELGPSVIHIRSVPSLIIDLKCRWNTIILVK